MIPRGPDDSGTGRHGEPVEDLSSSAGFESRRTGRSVTLAVGRHGVASAAYADLPSGSCNAATLALAIVDSVDEARGADGGVNGSGADVRVAGELADHSGVGAGVGEVGAERVAQHVGGAPVLG